MAAKKSKIKSMPKGGTATSRAKKPSGQTRSGSNVVSPTKKDMQKPSGRAKQPSARVKGKTVGKDYGTAGKAAGSGSSKTGKGTGRGTKIATKTLVEKTKRKLKTTTRTSNREVAKKRVARAAIKTAISRAGHVGLALTAGEAAISAFKKARKKTVKAHKASSRSNLSKMDIKYKTMSAKKKKKK